MRAPIGGRAINHTPPYAPTATQSIADASPASRNPVNTGRQHAAERHGGAVTRLAQATARSVRARQWMVCQSPPRAPPGEGRRAALKALWLENRPDLARCPPLDRLRRSQNAPSVQKVNVSGGMFPNCQREVGAVVHTSSTRDRPPVEAPATDSQQQLAE